MKFITLKDYIKNISISIDYNNMLLAFEADGALEEVRLKPFYNEVLYAIFSKHPKPVSYTEITDLLMLHKLMISDITRLHRKMSELKKYLESQSPLFKDIFINSRNHGYGLSFNFKPIKIEDNGLVVSNTKIAKYLDNIKDFIDSSISEIEDFNIIKNDFGYIVDTKKFKDEIFSRVISLDNIKEIFIEELMLNKAEFKCIRLEYCFATLKTYIGHARISEYPITPKQWGKWFETEIWKVYNSLVEVIISSGN